MLNKKIILGTLAGLIVLASTSSIAAQMKIGTGDAVAREASEGPRGADNERTGDRQRRGGRMGIDSPSDFVVAREASEGPRGGDNERPGDRQRRGGRTA